MRFRNAMRGALASEWVVWLALGCCAGLMPGKLAAASGGGGAASCQRAVVEGEVARGQAFERRLGEGLEVLLEPLASGWILRVLPYGAARGAHDYAELATPPYQSVNPLLIGTDFSFRAQDAVAWNPRRFRYASSAEEFARLAAAYERFRATDAPSAAVQAELAELAGHAREGTMQILDARLVPGTADQAQTARGVATHFEATPHRMEQPADGKASPLGRVTWMRFRMTFDLRAGFQAEAGMTVGPRVCP